MELPKREDKIEILDFKWGKKGGIGGRNKDVQFYQSFTYDGLEYSLYDNVYLHKEGEPLPYIGKLIKIWENSDKSKRVKVLWYFQPIEISNYLVVELAHPSEVFLASGEGVGLANINPLEAISGKCNVVCISKDSRNPQPSDEELQMADFVFYRTFDVRHCNILDKIDDQIAGIDVKFIFNQVGCLKPCSVHNFGVDNKNASENALETNETVILSELNSSENQIPEDDRQEEQKPVIGEKLAANDRQENGFNYETASSYKLEENSCTKVREKHVSGVGTELGELTKTCERLGTISYDKIGSSREVKENVDLKVPLVKQENTSAEKIGSVDEKLKSVKDLSELDKRPHKKAKLDSSVKVSSEHTTCNLPKESPLSPLNDGIKIGNKAQEVTRRPDSPWEGRMRDAHEHGKLVLFHNLDPAYTSAEVEDIVYTVFKEICSAKILQRTVYSSPHSGHAFAIFKTSEVAEEIVTKLDEGCLLLPNRRPLVASFPNPCFPRKQSTFSGHLILDKLKTQWKMKGAVSTSHSSQPNSLEYDLAVEWCLQIERSSQFWKKLYEQHMNELEKLKAKFMSK
ncbi:hypothetical protein PTKIN_Ptkin19aG0112500 [Pterospermum kingtungense]